MVLYKTLNLEYICSAVFAFEWYAPPIRRRLMALYKCALIDWLIDTITGYNGACAKVNVVFTARCYALARSLLTSGVCPSVRHVRVLYPDGWRYQTSFFQLGSAITLVFWPQAPIPNSKGNPYWSLRPSIRVPLGIVYRRVRKIWKTRGLENVRLSTEIAVYLVNGTT